jgi:diguanylate cyclase (GGDEF)-like protein
MSTLVEFGVAREFLPGSARNHPGISQIEETKLGDTGRTSCISLRKLLTSLAAVLVSLSTAFASEQGTLTSLRAVHALSNAEADHAIPVAFQATVVYSRGYESLLFVQDGDSALFVNPATKETLVPGDRIFIKGKTQGSFRPLVVASAITLLHHGTIPKPVPATFDELIRAQYDSRLVSAHATVRAVDLVVSPAAPVRSARLQLVMDGGHIEANVDSDGERPLKDLMDDDVEITGVAAGKFDDKMQQTGVVLYVSNLRDVKVLKRIDTRFWSLPITPMDQILSGYHLRDMSHRIQVHGTITYYEPGSAVVLQDGTKSLWISTLTREPLQIGDYAVASGFPDAHDRILALNDSEILDSHIPAPITPKPATWRQLAFWNSSKPDGHQNDLVSIDGQIVKEVREATQDEYVMDADGRLFTAIYRHPRGGAILPPMRQIPLGTRIRVTGICAIVDTHGINPGTEVSFDILLRSFDDIAVVARPSLMNVRNLILLVGLLLVLLFAAGVREWVRERKVRRQNAAVAYIERLRSRILEDINGSRPLAEIIEQIVDLASFKLRGAACWCQIVDGAKLGNCPRKLDAFRVVEEQIPARSGPPLGVFYAAFHPRTKPVAIETEALSMAASMATLAIETRRLYSDLQHRSQFDLLTDIHNRFSLETYLEEHIEKVRQDAGIFGLIYIDLNDFKQVNDVYGHHVGDLYLQEAAVRMKHALRPGDMLARLGGDEFAVLVPRPHSRKDVEEIAQRLERSFDAPYSFDGYVLHGSASVGIALYPEDGTTRESLLSAADAAMYVVKQTKKQVGEPSSGRRNPVAALKDRA